MKKFVMGLLSIVLVLVSIWGINTKGKEQGGPKPSPKSDTTLWI